MKAYKDLLREVKKKGVPREDRTGVGTKSLFAEKLDFNLRKGFPAVTSKKLQFRSVVDELVWMLSGSTNVNDLECGIWDEWSDEDGDLGPVYGKQWRSWGSDGVLYEGIDQIDQLVESLTETPYSRRHIVSAWNVDQIDEMALPPCHLLFQYYVRPFRWPGEVSRYNPGGEVESVFGYETGLRYTVDGDEGQVIEMAREAGLKWGYLDCQVYQRSADAFLGLPFNIASYALLTHMLGDVAHFVPGRLSMTLGDVHIYKNHADQVQTYLDRPVHDLPELELTSRSGIGAFGRDDARLTNYSHEPPIEAPIAV